MILVTGVKSLSPLGVLRRQVIEEVVEQLLLLWPEPILTILWRVAINLCSALLGHDAIGGLPISQWCG